MRVWIDIDNPPQVRCMLPLARRFEEAGHDVLLTAREYGDTFAILTAGTRTRQQRVRLHLDVERIEVVEPRRLLADIPGLSLREIASAEICCGSAGVWNVLNPEPARELGDRKARDVLATGADLLVTANPGCLMQVAAAVHRAGGVIGLAHTVQVLDASIRGLPAQSLLHS
jgi:hypothetical protein